MTGDSGDDAVHFVVKVVHLVAVHENVCVGVSEGAEVGHGVLNERPKDKAEADSQVNINGLDEAVGIGQ